MKCTKCGTELKEGARFCKSCGSKVKEVIQDSAVAVEPLENKNDNAEQLFKEIRNCLEKLEFDWTKKPEIDPKVLEESQALKMELLENHDLIEKQIQKIAYLESEVERFRKTIEKQEIENMELKKQLEELKKNIESEAVPTAITACPKCQTPADENTIFCGECGTKIR